MQEIQKRTSIRKYTEKQIEQEKIEKILTAGVKAPSAGNQQPWEFVVVSDKEKLVKLAGVSPYANCLKTATLAIIVCANNEKFRFEEYWQQDCSACTENILLEVVNQGLGAVWLGIAPGQERMDYITEMFDLDKNLLPFNIISIGYPAEGSDKTNTVELDKSIVHYIK